jgi:regulator of sigma E protease
LKIDGKTIATDMDMVMILQSDEDGVFEMTVRRDGEKKQLSGVTFELVQDAQSGERYLKYDFKVKGIRRTLGSTIVQAGKMEYSLTVMVWRSLGGILTGTYGLNDLSGPVGTVGFIGDAVSAAVSLAGLQSLLQLVAMITINVGVFNLLPVPALDGGRLLFLVFEGITRKKVPAKYESMVHFIGLLLLFGLMIVVTFTDIRRLITG